MIGQPGALLREACRRDVARTALKVSLLVGAALNGINQGSALTGGESVQWGTLVLNFVVPYCVSSYSAAVRAVRDANRTRK